MCLPYPSVIITCTNILLFLEICLFLLIEWMLGDIVFFISLYSVAFGVILSLLFVCLFFCTVEDISTQDGAIGVKFWLRIEQTPGTGTR